MTSWTGDVVSAVLGSGRVQRESFTEVSTDTRTLNPGALFVALSGDRFDGHNFLDAAAEAGAHGAVVRRGTTPVVGLELVEVDDPRIAYGALANSRRQSVTGPVVGVTGTNGKTSTKEMLSAALGTRWNLYATPANLNNLIGVPQTILAAPENTEALVIEAGANEPGEIRRLREIIDPTLAVVTNVSAGHLQGFGTLEATLAEKTSFLRGVPVAVVGTRPPALKSMAYDGSNRVVSAGLEDADVAPERWSMREDGRAQLTFRGLTVDLPTLGRHQAENAMLTLAVSELLDLDLPDVTEALAGIELPAGRCEILRLGGLWVLNDTYNANPESLVASLETAAKMRAGRPLVVIVGSMLELGDDDARLHGEAAEAIGRVNPKFVGALGSFVKAFEARGLPADRLILADDVAELGRAVRERRIAS